MVHSRVGRCGWVRWGGVVVGLRGCDGCGGVRWMGVSLRVSVGGVGGGGSGGGAGAGGGGGSSMPCVPCQGTMHPLSRVPSSHMLN